MSFKKELKKVRMIKVNVDATRPVLMHRLLYVVKMTK